MKKKLSEKQQELVALLPEGLPKMPNGAKIVLGFIILRYGTEYAKKYGYIFRSNKQLMQDTDLTEPTVIASVRKLELLGLISTIRGKRDTDGSYASYYYLSDDMKKKINFSLCTKINGDDTKINEGITKINVEGLFDKIERLELRIKELEEDNLKLKGEVILAKGKFYFSTDTEKEQDSKNLYRNKSLDQVGKIFDRVCYEDTPRRIFNQKVEECFSKLDKDCLEDRVMKVLGDIPQWAEGIEGAIGIVDDYLTSYGDRFGWTVRYKSHLLDRLFPNADAKLQPQQC